MAWFRASGCIKLLIFNILFIIVSCERAKEKMYENINGVFCFKRLNGTHEFGCTSSRSGNTGVLHIIKSKDDLRWLLNESKAPPYIVMMSLDFPDFKETLMTLKNSGIVSGIVLTSNRTSYSPDDVCPNRYSGLSQGQCNDNSLKWNAVGSSLLFINFGFPIMYIDSVEYPKDIEFLHQCFEKHNAHDMSQQPTRPLCALELTSHMLAAVDSKTCIRRSEMNNLTPFGTKDSQESIFMPLFDLRGEPAKKVRYCDPLLGVNIHLPLYPRKPPKSESERKKRSVILVVARLDGSSMFDGMVPGAGSPVVGIVSLLTVAHVLANLTRGKSPPEKNVMFVLFHGESYDYIGSSRMIYDMEKDSFPHKIQPDIELQSDVLRLEDIGFIIELDQVNKNEIFYHSLEKVTDKDEVVNKFVMALKSELKKLSMGLSGSIGRLPPASLQRFLKKDPKIKGLVLSSYNSSFDNKFYHSILDTGKNLNFNYLNKTKAKDDSIQKYVADYSLAVARSIYQVLFDETAHPNRKSEEKLVSLVDELFYCYLESPSCEIFQNVTFRKPLDKKPYSYYVGVVRNSNITTLTSLTLAWLTGVEVDRNRSSCHNSETDLMHQYFWMVGSSESGVCIESLLNYSIAQSPAFDIQNYDWSSREYSTWTESVWQENMSARIFIKPSKKHEILTLLIGLFISGLSFVIVYFLNVKASIIFNQQALDNGRC